GNVDADPFGGGAADPFGGAPTSDPFGGANAFATNVPDPNAYGATAPFGTPGHSLAPTPFSSRGRETFDSLSGSPDSGNADYSPSAIPPPPEPQQLQRQAGGG